ncbi:MAG: hypothetical protein LBI38_07870 [Oscillospiraceae bacterium]|jgi:hypothetical protein|nr:hypothetical protein [Oscillospiraceae bacterium]
MKKRILSTFMAFVMIIGVVFAPETGFAPNAGAAELSLAQREKAANKAADKIIKTIPKGASDFEKVRVLYDYVMNGISVSNDWFDGTGYDGLVNRDSGLISATRVFEILLTRAGIKNVVVKDDDNAWNMVSLNGKRWYHCRVGYTFLVSDKVMKAHGESGDYKLMKVSYSYVDRYGPWYSDFDYLATYDPTGKKAPEAEFTLGVPIGSVDILGYALYNERYPEVKKYAFKETLITLKATSKNPLDPFVKIW